MTECFSAGFPHSDICGSSDICSLPQLFAAYHVLLRLLVPRHPPYALLRLIIPVRLRRTGQVASQLEVLRFSNCFLFEVILLSFQKIRLSTFFFDKIDSRTEHFLDLNSILISTHFLSLISRLSSVKDLSFTDLRLICNFQGTFRFSSLKTQQYNTIFASLIWCERTCSAASHHSLVEASRALMRVP